MSYSMYIRSRGIGGFNNSHYCLTGMTKHLIIGLGLIGSSFLNIVKDQGLFDSQSFYCIDCNLIAKDTFVNFGGYPDHFSTERFSKNNFKEILNQYSDGDFILDFANDINNIEVLQYCLNNKLHYLSVADSYWDLNDPKWVSVHQHYKAYAKLSKRRRRTGKTSIIEFGMNPGLVSCFAKKCLEQIVESDQGDYITKRRNHFISLLEKKKYNVVARKIKVRSIIEVDHDNQVFDIPEDHNCVYSTWSPESFYHEELSAPEIIFGTWREFSQFQKVRDCDFFDYYVSLRKNGIDCKEEVFSPQGVVSGSLITHEEIFSISNYFKSLFYKPTSFFIYKPCEQASRSVVRNRHAIPKFFCSLTKDRLVSGGESVGIIMQGKRFETAYYGNYLNSETLSETATVLQVSASSFAAYKYIINHPNEGFLFPEELDSNEVLSYAKPYLKSYIFQKCQAVNPVFGNETFRAKKY